MRARMPWNSRRSAAPPRRRQFQLLDVRARDERSSAADDDDGASRRILLRGIQSRHQAFGNSRAQRVHGRIIDGDDGDAILRRQVYEFVHSCNMRLPPRVRGSERAISKRIISRLYCGGIRISDAPGTPLRMLISESANSTLRLVIRECSRAKASARVPCLCSMASTMER